MAAQQPPKAPDKKPQVSKAEALDELRYLQQLYQTQYMMINQEAESRINVLRELEAARFTLENHDSVKGRKSMTPLGAGVFVNSTIGEGGTVVMDVGAGYMVERKVDEAKGAIAKKLDKDTENIKKLQKNKKDLESALVDIAYRIDALSYE